MSKVVKFYEFGELDILKLEEEPLRQPQAGEVVIGKPEKSIQKLNFLEFGKRYTLRDG
jgi:hypothetical protein